MAEVGSAFISLAPSMKGFGRKMEAGVGSEVKSSGGKIGKTFGQTLTRGLKLGGLTAGVPSAPLFRVGPEELG